MLKRKRIVTALAAIVMTSSLMMIGNTAFAATTLNTTGNTFDESTLSTIKDSSKASNNTSVNPDDYINKTTVKVLPASKVKANISKRTQEFKGLVQNCTKVAYAYADPTENANATYNTNPSGAKSLAVYIFGYDNSTTAEFLNTKKYIPYVLNKLYFDSKLNNTWYKTLTNNGNGIYIILEKPGALDANEKFGNPNDGFGMRLIAGTMTDSEGAVEIMFHEMAHCIEDSTSTTNDFYFGVDPRTKINYGTGNLVTLWNKLYDDSIKKNNFYAGSYGWDYSHENFAETSSRFFRTSFRSQLKAKDPIVYNIMNQIYNQFNF